MLIYVGDVDDGDDVCANNLYVCCNCVGGLMCVYWSNFFLLCDVTFLY
jgi:hypothetical protein